MSIRVYEGDIETHVEHRHSLCTWSWNVPDANIGLTPHQGAQYYDRETRALITRKEWIDRQIAEWKRKRGAR